MVLVEMTLAMTPWDRIQPLLNGEVRPKGVRLRYVETSLGERWDRQLSVGTFDISDMSLSNFLRARAMGWGYRALPVFHNRYFPHAWMLYRAGSGIESGRPETLRGKRIGVIDYQTTAEVWTRGVLEHEFGVKPHEIEWFPSRSAPALPGEESPFAPPPGVTLRGVVQDQVAFFLAGGLDALLGTQGPPQPALAGRPEAVGLFQDVEGESVRYFQKTGVFPINHVVIVREAILTQHPWIAQSLFDAFVRAQALAVQRISQLPPSHIMFAFQALDRQQNVFGENPFAYGLAANARPLDAFQTFSVEQGLTARKQPWSELFAASTQKT